MTREQVTNLCDRIKTHYRSFDSYDDIWDEWFRYLEIYDSKEVNDQLDKYLFQNSEMLEKKAPSVFDLFKNLTPLEQYVTRYIYKTNCKICGRILKNTELDKHFDRCSSIDYIYRNARNYFNQQVSKSDFWKLSDEQFEKGYWSFCEKLLNCNEVSPLEKAGIRNAILAHSGCEVDGTNFFKELANTYKKI